MNSAILLVDDEIPFLNSVKRKLRLDGYTNVTSTPDPHEAAELATQRQFDVAFLDLIMPGLDGLELLEHIKSQSPQTECIMVTANENIPSVVQAIKLGAYDYLVKPIQPDKLVHVLERALERKRMLNLILLKQALTPQACFENPDAFSHVITGDGKMLRVLREAELHAQSDIVVLITGETGVGKELLARAVHQASKRAERPFVAVNMLSLSPGLFESEFFGHVKGAFTGADREKSGYLSQARGGSLFLDEIGDLSLEIQGKLLRVLQEKEFIPVGGTHPQPADIRFIAATNQDLAQLVQKGNFRKDLYYRLQFACLHLPPLRERVDDILRLAAHFLDAAGRSQTQIDDPAQNLLLTHNWPGNVRELKGVIQAAANLAESGTIRPQHLNLPHKSAAAPGPQPAANGPESVVEPLAAVERRHILAVYGQLGHNKTHTAKALGIGMATLQRKLKAYEKEAK